MAHRSWNLDTFFKRKINTQVGVQKKEYCLTSSCPLSSLQSSCLSSTSTNQDSDLQFAYAMRQESDAQRVNSFSLYVLQTSKIQSHLGSERVSVSARKYLRSRSDFALTCISSDQSSASAVCCCGECKLPTRCPRKSILGRPFVL